MEYQDIEISRIKKFDFFFFPTFFCLLILQIEPVRIGAGQFGCPICSKFMKNQRDMKRHIMVHTGEKPFTCNYCDFACNFQGSLNRHIKNRHNVVLKIE